MYHHWYWGDYWCLIVSVSGSNSAPSLVSVGGIMHHCWCQWGGGGECPILGVIGRKSAPSLVLLGGRVPHPWCH
ncbi:unnamed protein product [Staurois parvus]|uniref:Uncharacterized protein n=1 Tax=Staurois parvus TaxID=386267 RepID=A0ABN9E4S7_9NEOB|nr:unnamed protein product [Staurois parvus]